jgi:hypothetical protein
MYCTLADIHAGISEQLYAPTNRGLVIIRDGELRDIVVELGASIEHQTFDLKEYQHINNGQMYYHFEPLIEFSSASDRAVKSLVALEHTIRSAIAAKFPESVFEYGFTRYPVSAQGAAFHMDFSYNVNCVITFFFGDTSIWIADTKEEDNKTEYSINAGDIVIMRSPRNFQKEEIALRPIHAIGAVSTAFYAFETREVMMERKNALKS